MGFTYYDSDAIRPHDQESLQHHGVLGMKWGQRRFQNKDGSLTAAGKKHYEKTGEYGYQYHSHSTKKYQRKAAKNTEKLRKQLKKDITSTTENGMTTHHVKFTGKLKKLASKVEKYENRAKRSAELDAREQEYAQRVRAGGNIAARMLTSGLIGGKAYQQHLAMNKDTKSAGSKAMAAIGGYAFGRIGSSIRKANYLRQDEKAAKRAAKGKASDRGTAFREKAAAARAAFESGVNSAANAAKNEYNKQKKKRNQ